MPRLTKDQIARRLDAMDALRDVRVGSAVWAAGAPSQRLNENGQEVMRNLHSPISTLQHMWCDQGEIGAQFRVLVLRFLAEQETM